MGNLTLHLDVTIHHVVALKPMDCLIATCDDCLTTRQSAKVHAVRVSISARTQNSQINVNVAAACENPNTLSSLQMRWKHTVRRKRTELDWSRLQMMKAKLYIELFVLDSDTVRYAAVVQVVRNIGSAALNETKHSKRKQTYQKAHYKSASTADDIAKNVPHNINLRVRNVT